MKRPEQFTRGVEDTVRSLIIPDVFSLSLCTRRAMYARGDPDILYTFLLLERDPYHDSTSIETCDKPIVRLKGTIPIRPLLEKLIPLDAPALRHLVKDPDEPCYAKAAFQDLLFEALLAHCVTANNSAESRDFCCSSHMDPNHSIAHVYTYRGDLRSCEVSGLPPVYWPTSQLHIKFYTSLDTISVASGYLYLPSVPDNLSFTAITFDLNDPEDDGQSSDHVEIHIVQACTVYAQIGVSIGFDGVKALLRNVQQVCPKAEVRVKYILVVPHQPPLDDEDEVTHTVVWDLGKGFSEVPGEVIVQFLCLGRF